MPLFGSLLRSQSSAHLARQCFTSSRSSSTSLPCAACGVQVVMSRGGYTEAIDMWGCGCVFGELLQRVAWIGKATTPQLQVGRIATAELVAQSAQRTE
jgi:mitogen-activated protein kinase 1/3